MGSGNARERRENRHVLGMLVPKERCRLYGYDTDEIPAQDLADTELEVGGTSISMDSGVLDTIGGDTSITVSAQTHTPEELGLPADQFNTNKIFDFSINGGAIHDFGEENFVTVTVPYPEFDPEVDDVDNIAIWFISDECQKEDCERGDSCDELAHRLVSIRATYHEGYVTFKTNHFSSYTVTLLTPAERCALYGHGWTEQTVVGSCTQDGYTLRVCVRCHEREMLNFTPATGHNYLGFVTAATCTTRGSTVRTCSHCSHSYTVYTNALGHNWEVTDSADATCVADGFVKKSCTRADCHEEYTVALPKLPHAYTRTTVAATCTADGYTLYDCDNCDYAYTGSFVAALGHAYGAPTWSWANDYSTANATFTCAHDSAHVTTVAATITKTETTGSCSGNAQTIYVATVTYNGTDYTNQQIVESGTPSHTYSTEWSSDAITHWHACACGAKSDEAAHTYVRGVCVCGATQAVTPPPVADSYFINLINSYKNIDGIAIKVEDLSFEVKENTDGLVDAFRSLGRVRQVSVAELALYVEDGTLGGGATGCFEVCTNPFNNNTSTYDFKAVIYNGFVYFTVEYGSDAFRRTQSAKITVDAMFEEMVDGAGVSSSATYAMNFVKDTLIPAVDTLIAYNADEVEEILANAFNMIFTLEEQADGSFVATHDYEKLYALNDNLATKTVAEVIDLYFGEGSFDNLAEGARAILSLKLSEIPAYLDEQGLSSSDLIEEINAFCAEIGAPAGFDIEAILNSEEYADVTLGMLLFRTQDAEQIEAFIDSVVESLSQTTLYAMIAPEHVEDVQESVAALIGMIEDYVAVSFTTDESGMLTSVCLEATDLVLSVEDDVEINLNAKVELIMNGRIDITWMDIVTEIESGIVLPEDLMGSNMHYEIEGSYGGTITFQGVEYWYEGDRIIVSNVNDDELSGVVFYNDCGDWMYYTMAFPADQYCFTFAEAYPENGGESIYLLIDVYGDNAVKIEPTGDGYKAIYEDGSEKMLSFVPTVGPDIGGDIIDGPSGGGDIEVRPEQPGIGGDVNIEVRPEKPGNGDNSNIGGGEIGQLPDDPSFDAGADEEELLPPDDTQGGIGTIMPDIPNVDDKINGATGVAPAPFALSNDKPIGSISMAVLYANLALDAFENPGTRTDIFADSTEFYYNTVTGEFAYESQHETNTEYELHGESCEDGWMRITTCANCALYEEYVSYYHNSMELARVDLSAHGACYGELVLYGCPCGENQHVSYYDNCAHSYSSNEYKNDDGHTVSVETRTCPSCGLRITREVYSVKNSGACTRTYYYSVVINIGSTLVYETEYTTVDEDHDYEIETTLDEGEGSSCEDGVTAIYTCRDCGEGYERHYYWHDSLERERIALDSECGGYAVLYGCACGEQVSLSIDHSLCEMSQDEMCNVWVPGAIQDNQKNIDNWGYHSYAYIKTCAVTDPVACGYKIRYAVYWLKDPSSCTAFQYQTWQFGYDEVTGTCERELTFATGEKRICHNYVDNSSTNRERYDCVDCESYYEYRTNYDSQNNYLGYEKNVFNEANAVLGRSDEYLTETQVPYTNSSLQATGWKYTYYRTYSDGRVNSRENAEVVLGGYTYPVYSYYSESYADGGEYWYRYDYTYSFVGTCQKTVTYTDSDGEYRTRTENACASYEYVTVLEPTCTQDGLRYRECHRCHTRTETYVLDAHDHRWVVGGELGYYCSRCGLENQNGASGDIIMEDLTEQYGDGRFYVVGYCLYRADNVQFSTYISLVWEDGREVIVSGIEYAVIDDIRAYAFSKADVDAWAEANGYTGYNVKFTFVPVGSDGSFDYGLTFTEENIPNPIVDSISFMAFVGEGETVTYRITPVVSETWTFTSEANGDTYGYLYDADGNELDYNDDGGTNTNFSITYTLEAGRTYEVRVRWYSSSNSGIIPLYFTRNAS